MRFERNARKSGQVWLKFVYFLWGYECVQMCTWNEKLPSSRILIRASIKRRKIIDQKYIFEEQTNPFPFSQQKGFSFLLCFQSEYANWTNIFEIFERYSGEGKSRRIIGEDGRPRFQIFGEIEMTNRYISGVRFHWRRSTIGLSIRRRIDRIRSSIVNRDGNFPSMENGSFISRILRGKGGAGWKRLTSYIAACIIKLFVICF